MAVKERLTMPGQLPTSWKRPKRSTVVLFALAAIVYDAFLLLSSPPQGTLDAKLFYTAGAAVEFLSSSDESARAVYRLFCTFDFAFMVVYTALFVTWFRFLRNRAALPRRAYPVLAVVPAMFDLAETVSIFVMLGGVAEAPAALPYVAAVATPLKWLSAAGVVVAIIAGERRWFRLNRARRRAASKVSRPK